ncbi:MAG: DUF58 domain-containing protein [Anaerolineaceae bacterium]|jgi:uncharacterized protein (DUF58 family)|nr:DUF58 domain-containing protein [Anaerolineaceae bacterium]
MKLRPTFWYILAILAASIWGAFRTQAELFSNIIFLCVLLLITSYVMGVFSVRGYEVRRSSREARKEYGQVFEERFEVENTTPFVRLWLEVMDGSTLAGGGGARVLSWVGKRERRNYSAYTLLLERGDVTLGPTILHSGDLFGLFAFQKVIPHVKHLMTLPYLADIDSFPYPPGLLPGGKAQRFRSLEVTPHAAGVREYVPGDALKRIHWPSSAKKNKLIVKEFEQNPQASVWILLDAEYTAHRALPYQPPNPKVDQFWLWKHREEIQLPPKSFEYAVSIAASIGKYFIRSGQDVGMACAGKRLQILSAERGQRQLGKLLELLAFVHPDGKMPLRALVEAQISHIARGSVVVLVTTSLTADLAGSVEQILWRDLRPVVVVVDAHSFGAEPPKDEEAAFIRLQGRNVPVVLVRRGDSLKAALESGFSRSYVGKWGPAYDVKKPS